MPKYESKCPQHTELDIYNGCSYNCIYCISHDENKQVPFQFKEELSKIADNQIITQPYYLSPWTDAYQHIEAEKQYSRKIIQALSTKNQAFFVIPQIRELKK